MSVCSVSSQCCHMVMFIFMDSIFQCIIHVRTIIGKN